MSFGESLPMKLFLLDLLLALLAFAAPSEGAGNSGNEFYLACAPNRFDKEGQCTFYITTEETTTVSVVISHKSVSGNSGSTVTTVKGSTTIYQLPTALTLGTAAMYAFRQSDFGVHFKAEEDKKIIIYSVNEDQASTDGYLALPKHQTVSGEYVYFVMSYTRPKTTILGRVRSFIIVVGTEDNTVFTVTIKLASGNIVLGPLCRPAVGFNGQKATCTIGRGGTFAAFSLADLTGTKIESNKPLTMYAGHQCAQVPNDVTACDHLIEQMPPVENLGFRHVLSPSLGRTGDAVRVLAVEDDTVIKIACNNGQGISQPVVSATINSGMFHERILPARTGFCFIESDLPVAVAQYALGHSYDNTVQTDPFMILIPPLGQFRRYYTIVFVDSQMIDTQGVRTRFSPKLTIIIPVAHYQPNQILFDGDPIEGLQGSHSTIPIKDQDGVVRVYAFRWDVPKSVPLGDHTVEHTKPAASIGIIVYGFERENSYGYVGGMELNPLAVTTFCFDGLNFEASEGDGAAALRLQRTGPTKARVCIATECADGSAMAGVHYQSFSQDCCFESGSSLAVCNVPLIDNGVCGEPDRSFTCNLKPQPEQMACNHTSTVTIKDDDKLMIGLTDDMFRVDESAGSVEVCVRMSGCLLDEPLPLSVQTTPSAQDILAQEGSVLATAESDYDSSDLGYIIPAGKSSVVVCKELPIIDDFVVESSECLGIELIAPGDVTVQGSSTGTVCITDDDVEVMLMFKTDEVDVTEGEGLVEVCLMSSEKVPSETTVKILLSDCPGEPCDGAANAGSDYNDGDYMVVFGAGQTRACVMIPIQDDSVLEKKECFKVNYMIPDDAPGVIRSDVGPNEVNINVVDDDVLSVQFSPASYSVHESEGLAMMTLQANTTAQCPFNVEVFTQDRSATAPSDYISYEKNLVQFPAMTTTLRLDVIIIDDEDHECAETFMGCLTVPDQAAESGVVAADEHQCAPVTIATDSSDDITVGFVDPSPVTVTEGLVNVEVSVRLSRPSLYPVKVQVKPLAGSADSGRDFLAVAAEVIFTPGSTRKRVNIPIVDDDVSEPDETFSISLVVLESCPGVSVEGVPLEVVVKDNDSIECGWEPPQYSIKEDGGLVELSVACDGHASRPICLAVSFQDGLATDLFDYASLESQTITINPGSTTGTFPVPILDDSVLEKPEDFSAILSLCSDDDSGLDITVGVETSTTTIIDDDVIQCGFSPTTYHTDEDNDAMLKIKCNGTASYDYVVMVTTEEQSATEPEDYDGGKYNVVILAGETMATLDVPITTDTILEGNETFLAILSTAVSDSIVEDPEASTADVIIIDDVNDIVMCAFSQPEYTVSESSNELCLILECTGEFSVPFNLQVLHHSNLEAMDGSDFVGASQAITFEPGLSSMPVCVRIPDDGNAECNEKFSTELVLPGITSELGVQIGRTSIALVTIRDDDIVTCMFAGLEGDIVIEESKNATIHVMLSGASSRPIQCLLTTEDISATSGMDYQGGSKQAVFLPGESQKTVVFPSIDDREPEAKECYKVTLSTTEQFSACGAVVGERREQIVCLIDNDAVVVNFDPDRYSVEESSGEVELFVKISNSAVKDFMVDITCTSGTASAGSDFVSGPHPVTIPMGSMGAMATVPITMDDVYEGEEKFSCVITADSSTGITPGEKDTASITVDDDDCVQFSVSKYCVDLESGTASGVVTASIEVERTATVLIYAADRTTGLPVRLEEEGGTAEVNFEPGAPRQADFSLNLEEGDLVRYLPLNPINPDCQPRATPDTSGGYVIPLPPTSPTPPPHPPKNFISAGFDLQRYTVQNGQDFVVVNVSLNDTAKEEQLCLRVSTQDQSAVGSVHYQGGAFRVSIAQDRSRGLARIPIFTNRIEQQVQFSLQLEPCPGAHPDTQISIVRGSARAVIPHPLGKPSPCPSVAPSTVTASASSCPVTTTITQPTTTCSVSTRVTTETFTVASSCSTQSCPAPMTTTTTATIVSTREPEQTSCPVATETTTKLVTRTATPPAPECPSTPPTTSCDPSTVTRSVVEKSTETLTQVVTRTASTTCPPSSPCPSPTPCPSTPHPACALKNSCYVRSPNAKEACRSDIVALVKTTVKRFLDTCIYQVKVKKVYKGSALLSTALSNKLISLYFPPRSCSSDCEETYINGCLVLPPDQFYLVGTHLRVDHQGHTLVAELPQNFVLEQPTSKQLKKLTQLSSCTENN
uniref:IgGFc-binding protein-like protein 1 n=1 Tax=Halisarca dujardinii TaxID=2583056 RepID=A0AA96S1R7_HALDU|nr:IgGFc-binding protein-like protein 1 [Halisarca dujardinii]